VNAFQELALGLARVDVLASLASLAAERRYCRPTISDERVLEIVDGKHPVLEQQLGSEFVANDCRFGPDDSLALITGPNMAGTSTLDGLSLAWAIAEHIAADVHCRTLFATHYHELTDLAQRFRGVKNLNVAVREWEDQVVFLHRIVEGGTDRSYGIHVARLAGVPRDVLDRARQLLGELAVHHVGKPKLSRGRKSDREVDDSQLPLFIDPAKELLNDLTGTNVEQLTPIQAFDLLRRWKEKYGTR